MRALWVGAVLSLIPGCLAWGRDAGEIYWDSIQPVFEKQCYGCHGAAQALSKLDVSSREAMLRGGQRGPSVEPGKSGASLLYQALTGQKGLQMPPGTGKSLPADVIAAVKEWIDAGAPVPDKKPAEAAKWEYKPEDLWAFQPLKKVDAPKGGIDGFIRRELAGRGLKPAPQADRRTLIRRVTFDLTGLPPTPEETEAFLRDSSPDAYERLVERLLDSPRYGERWARHWLDVVRYADTDGYSNDFERPNAWRYRDYVIRSFQNDKPYDRFVMEQIAGDELDPKNPESLIATGFLRMGPWEHTAMSVAAVTRQQWLDDVTHQTGTVFLGMTMGCARCHDHKFDPIPTSDYYSLQAVFASTHFDQPAAPFLPGERKENFERETERIQKLIDWSEQRLKELDEKVLAGVASKKGLPDASALTSADRKAALQNKEGLDSGDLERERIYRKRLEIYRRELQRYKPLAFAVKSGAPEETRILVAGNLRSPGEVVKPAVASAAYKYVPAAAMRISEEPGGRRLALAKWIASASNPLTARVMVNRIWQSHFGKGIAGNTNNFGKMGKKPTHPELLDWLAGAFIGKGWSVKAVHRLILHSETYRQAASHPEAKKLGEADPNNDLLAYFPPRRVEAEELRDSVLAVAGALQKEAGGPGVFPEINADVADQPRLIMGTLAPSWQPSPRAAHRNRRTIYAFQQRGIPDPMMDVLNAPGSGDSCERRDSTTVPTQAFTMLNGKFIRDMALEFAASLAGVSVDPAERIDRAARLAWQRPPTPEEKQLLVDHWRKMAAWHKEAAPPGRAERKPLVRSLVGELTGKRFDYQEEGFSQDYEEHLHPADVPPETRALAEVALVLFNSNEFVYLY